MDKKKIYYYKFKKTVLMIELFKELLEFLKMNKKFWLLPIIIFLFLFGGLIILTQGTAIAPFIYTLF